MAQRREERDVIRRFLAPLQFVAFDPEGAPRPASSDVAQLGRVATAWEPRSPRRSPSDSAPRS